MIPDFEKYTLALFSQGHILFESNESRLKPLVEMVQIYQGQHTDCVLHDKIVGLASAKIIVASGMVSELHARVMSRPAIEFLRQTDINFTHQDNVEAIMNNEKTGPCPMEVKAREIAEPDEFLKAMIELMGV